ncbi:MAG: DEAD/DEAH box helicase [Polyangia bacterium]
MESESETVTSSQFAALDAHPTIVRALTAKGYLVPTPVQAAVLASPDSDLLVTAQTGSGKTVAFGLIVAKQLLGDADKITPAKMPRALVITPTRELAAQVQRELEWLFASTGARVASFTGGTDLRGDSRTLSRGVDIAVGTPGRLVDLVERKSLDLSGVTTVVLDEADEMLDMGFRDAIETILGSAPAGRRTLLFSATLPSEIRSLAKKYQKHAVPIDARSAVVGAHDDITYSAHLCASGQRTRALVNVLRMAEDERTLVFCRTRDDVGELHRELASRGFLAAAISGDRAQSERDRALETMRQGRVRVLVATNVAARGLDLPELSLVVHAALPENVEALTHRSGRTGRAGKKGRSLFLVEMGERRKAERLFHAAKLPITFTAPPSLEDVAKHERDALREEVSEKMSEPIGDAALELAEGLLADHDARQLVGALLDRMLASRPAGEKLNAVVLGPAAKPKDMKPLDGDYVLFEVNLGAKDQATPTWILPLVCKRGAITRREIGAIRVTRDKTFVEISGAAATEFAASAAERDPRAPTVTITRSEGSMPARTYGDASKGGKPTGPRRTDGPPRPMPARLRADASAHPNAPYPSAAPRATSSDAKPYVKAYSSDKPAYSKPSYSSDKPSFTRPPSARPASGGYGGGAPKKTFGARPASGGYGGGGPKKPYTGGDSPVRKPKR